MQFEGKVALISGASRGLGRRIARQLASEGADVAVAARTEEENPRLPGTIHATAEEVRAEGRRALALRMDATSADDIEAAITQTVAELGRLDMVVHTAAALFPTGIEETSQRRWDLMLDLNLRAIFTVMHSAAAPLREAGGGHLLLVSPTLDPGILEGPNVPYGVSKYAGTLLVVNGARELAEHGIAANCIWPAGQRRTEGMVALGLWSEEQLKNPQIFVDAAVAILAKPPAEFHGRAVTDEEMLALEGVTDLSRYDEA